MYTHNHRFLIIALIVISGLVLAWFMVRQEGTPAPVAEVPATTTPSALSGRSIYTNGEYGFTVTYPEAARLEEAFSPEYHISDAWRVNALPDGTGTPIAAVIAYSTESDHSYPRHFNAQVRIGASTDPDELARCLEAASEQGETPLPDANLNGTAWKAFEFGDAGMMQYVRGVSYRTVHEGACVAVEKMQIGSSYRDDPASEDDIADEVLQARYKSLDSIVESVTFARP